MKKNEHHASFKCVRIIYRGRSVIRACVSLIKHICEKWLLKVNSHLLLFGEIWVISAGILTIRILCQSGGFPHAMVHNGFKLVIDQQKDA